jgi:signal transduction histidine kinase
VSTIRQSLEHYDLVLAARKHKEELEKANQQLLMLYEKQKEFTSTVSHELRTPLASIKTAIDLVIKRTVGEINADQEDVLGRAKKNVDRLKRLIDDILDLTKIESGKLEMTLMSNDLHRVIQEVIEAQKDVASSRGLYVKTDFDETVPHLPFDSDRIIQVLNNLIGNAIKFTKEGGITVKTQNKSAENHIIVSVMDTGKGISETDIPKLFQKFQQLESAQDNAEGGTGLGLAICKEIISRHGGKIEVESKPGEGTAFSFILPIQERRVAV